MGRRRTLATVLWKIGARRVGVLAWSGVLAAVLVGGSPSLPPSQAGVDPPAVGVVDFYALSVISPFLGIVPERFSADDLTWMLAQAGSGRITLVPRAGVEQAERDLGWRPSDVLRYARMSDLAQRLHADRLVVGWIKQLYVDAGDFYPGFPWPNLETINATAVLQVQVFDTAQGRLVASRQFTGGALGVVPSFTAQEALHQALTAAVGPTLAVLNADSR